MAKYLVSHSSGVLAAGARLRRSFLVVALSVSNNTLCAVWCKKKKTYAPLGTGLELMDYVCGVVGVRWMKKLQGACKRKHNAKQQKKVSFVRLSVLD